MATTGLSINECGDESGDRPLAGSALDGGSQNAAMPALSDVLAQAPVALIACDGIGRIVWAAGGEIGPLGLGRGGIIGQYACDVWHHAPAMVAALQGARDGSAARVVVAAGPRMYEMSLTPRRAQGAIIGVIGVAVDVTERVASERDLRHRATHDALTQLPNRALFADRLDHALRAALRTRRPMAIVLLDLDGFKAINDTHGHATGDAVLVEVALRLARTVRVSDTVARLGGDEFGLVLPATDRVGTRRSIGQLQASLATVLVCDGVKTRVGISAGVAVWPDHGTDAKSLLGHADAALYRAKRTAVTFSDSR